MAISANLQKKIIPGIIPDDIIHLGMWQYMFDSTKKMKCSWRWVCGVSDKHTTQKLSSVCTAENRGEGTNCPGLEAMFFNNSPTQVLYNVEVSLDKLCSVFSILHSVSVEGKLQFPQKN